MAAHLSLPCRSTGTCSSSKRAPTRGVKGGSTSRPRRCLSRSRGPSSSPPPSLARACLQTRVCTCARPTSTSAATSRTRHTPSKSAWQHARAAAAAAAVAVAVAVALVVAMVTCWCLMTGARIRLSCGAASAASSLPSTFSLCSSWGSCPLRQSGRSLRSAALVWACVCVCVLERGMTRGGAFACSCVCVSVPLCLCPPAHISPCRHHHAGPVPGEKWR